MKVIVRAHSRKGGVHVRRHDRTLNRAAGIAAVHVQSIVVRGTGRHAVAMISYHDGKGNRGAVEGDPKGALMQQLLSRGIMQGKRIHFTGGAAFADIMPIHPRPGGAFNQAMGAGLSEYGRRVADDLRASHHWPAWMARCAVHEFPLLISQMGKRGASSHETAQAIRRSVAASRSRDPSNRCGANPCVCSGKEVR